MLIKKIISNFLKEQLHTLLQQRNIKIDKSFSIKIEYPPEVELGHYSSPCALDLSKILRQNPRQIAEELKKLCEENKADFLAISKGYIEIDSFEIAGPGFLNIFLHPRTFLNCVLKDYTVNSVYEQLKVENKSKKKVLLEFVSANPTGPLNIVSARAAALGDSLARILKAIGINIATEYYVNDTGNQVNLLGQSVVYRFLQHKGLSLELPENAYQGEYLKDVVCHIIEENYNELLLKVNVQNNFLETQEYIEWYPQATKFFGEKAIAFLLSEQQLDLKSFRVLFDKFFLETRLHEAKATEKAFQKLEEKGHIYEKDGAFFLKSTNYGDDKDRVLKKSDGSFTYFLADIAYHLSKIERGFTSLLNIWGPDHHGYITRLRGALQALGFASNTSTIDKEPSESFEVLISQQVNLLEAGKKLVMSKRLGQFSTMKDLTREIPVDVCRYFFLSRSFRSHLDFDLDLAREKSNKNPVFYIQYAYVRIRSIFRELNINYQKVEYPTKLELTDDMIKNLFSLSERKTLFLLLLHFFDEVNDIAQNYEVHRLASYLLKLAGEFTQFYHHSDNHMKKLYESDSLLFWPLLYLCQLTAETLEMGLCFLGIKVQERM